MRSLPQLMGQALGILARNLLLLYPVLAFLLLLGWLVPETRGVPQPDARWLALLAVLMMLGFAFMAGWFGMLYRATTNALAPDQPAPTERPADTPEGEPPLPTLGVFRAFFPAIGEFFGRFVLGGALQVVLLGLVIAGAHLVVEATVGYPEAFFGRLNHFLLEEPRSQAEIQRWLLAIPPAEQERVGHFFEILFVAMLAYGVLAMLTMFWPHLVVVRGMGVLQAYGASVARFFRDPFRVLALGLVYVMVNMGVRLVGALAVVGIPDVIAQVLSLFLSLMAVIWFTLLQFLYVIQAFGPRQVPSPPQPVANA